MTIGTIAAAWVLPGQTLIASHGIALNQNQVTYFCDQAIVEVVGASTQSVTRSVTGSFGRADKPFVIQQGRVVDANFEAVGSMTLVFPCTFYTNGRSRVGAMPTGVAGSLNPGRYLISGLLESNGVLQMTPDIQSLGLELKADDAPLRLVQVQAKEGELAVFSVVKTEDRSLNSHERDPESVLLNSLAAASPALDSLCSLADQFARTNNLAFADWRAGARPSAEYAVRTSKSRSGVEQAILLMLAFKCGESPIEADMLQALVASDKGASSYWSTDQGAELLQFVMFGAQPNDPAYRAWVVNPDRQVLVASLLSEASSDTVQQYLLSRATSKRVPRMDGSIRLLLHKAKETDPSCPLLLRRLSQWYEKPDRAPGPQLQSEDRDAYQARLRSILDVWRAELGA